MLLISSFRRINLFRQLNKVNFSSLSQSQVIQKPNKVETRRIAPKLRFDYVLDSNNDIYGQINTTNRRPLVVLMSWLRGEDKYLNVYNEFYMKRGFDVLTAYVGVYDMFYPDYTGKLCLKYLETDLIDYETVLIHSFSFGFYVFATILSELQKRSSKDCNSQSEQQNLKNRIKGVIFDSMVSAEHLIEDLDETREDLPRAFKYYIKSHTMFLKIFKNTQNCLRKGTELVYNNPLRVPALVMVSESDLYDNVSINKKLVDLWRHKDIDVMYQCWKNGPHIQLMKYNQEHYKQLIEILINKI